MTSLRLITISFLSVAFVGLGNLSAEPRRIDGIAATVNGRVITFSEVQSSVTAQKQVWATVLRREDPRIIRAKMKQVEEDALDALINRELILAEFKELEKQGAGIKEQYIDEDLGRIVRDQFEGDQDAFLAELARTGMSIRKFRELRREMLIVQFMRQMKTPQVPPPTPDEVQQFYKDHIREYTGDATIKLRTITIPKFLTGTTMASQKSLAADLRKQIDGGADFGALAKSYSRDSVADDEGDRGWVKPDEISKGISVVAFAMKSKSVSQVLDTPSAYVILYVEGRQEGDKTPLKEVRDQVENRIRQEKGKELQEKWLDLLRADAVIKRYQ